MSRRRSPVTPTKVKLAVQLAIRHRKLSAAISDMSRANAAIRRLRVRFRPRGRRPGISRHIGCLPNRQPPPRRRSQSPHVRQDAVEGSAARTEADDVRILKDCPYRADLLGKED